MSDQRQSWRDHFVRWPLLLAGLTLMTVAAFDVAESSNPWIPATIMAVGCVLVGSGIVLVSWGHRDPLHRDPNSRTRRTDRPRPAPDDTPTE